MRNDPAWRATVADARARNCCANDEWRGHACDYHQGFEAGYDAALSSLGIYPELEVQTPIDPDGEEGPVNTGDD